MLHPYWSSRCLIVACLATVVLAPAALGAAGPASSATCGWSGGFHRADLNDQVRALATYDDGSGPALYAGGYFTAVGTSIEPLNHVAKWDGTTWSALAGTSATGVNGRVHALAVFDDGSGPALFAGGAFTSAGGETANFIAKWDGTAWSALSGPSGNGLNGGVYALTVFDDGSGPALYVGGIFTAAGGVTANHIARWDGTTWSALSGPTGNGVVGSVFALAEYEDRSGSALYVGGEFNSAGGVTASRIARWNGTSWSALSGPSGNGITGMAVNALMAYDDGSGPALFAGGTFSSAGGVPANHIAKWNGTSWSALSGPPGNGVNNWVYALATYDDGSGPALHVGGLFTSAGAARAVGVAKWNGTTWSALAGSSAEVYALAAFDDGSGPVLSAGGAFTSAGGGIAAHIAKWNGVAWTGLSENAGNGVGGTVRALAVHDDGSEPALYAGGSLSWAGGVPATGIARWNGRAWSVLSGPSGHGLNGSVYALTVYDDGSGPALYAGGSFTSAGGVTATNIAKWNGIAWSALAGPFGNGVSGGVLALAVYDDGSGPALYVGGLFTSAGGLPASRIAKWNGTDWSALAGPSGTGVSDRVFALAVYNDGSGPALYAGGAFTLAGGLAVNYIAKWNGTTWSALAGPAGNGLSNNVFALAAHDDGSGPALFAGGSFTAAGGVGANSVARWNGTAWSALDGPAGNGVSNSVHALTVYDDGNGPALYAGGDFISAGGVTANRIAKWNGTAWSPLSGPAGTGVTASVYALAPYATGSRSRLFVGGAFGAAGGLASANIARWQCESPLPFAQGFESGNLAGWSERTP